MYGLALQPARRLDAVDAARHHEILNHHLRTPCVEPEQLFPALGDPETLQIGKRFEIRLEASRDDVVIVAIAMRWLMRVRRTRLSKAATSSRRRDAANRDEHHGGARCCREDE